VAGRDLRTLFFVMLTACGARQSSSPPSPLPSPPTSTDTSTAVDGSSSCTKDAECTITARGPCCTACATAPRAISRQDLEGDETHCGVVECMKPEPPPGGCPRTESTELYKAVCSNARCVAVKK
ncbi:MAG TPA: hypothetical protein VGH87_00540, partial [Polyangiaceae bacterium]